MLVRMPWPPILSRFVQSVDLACVCVCCIGAVTLLQAHLSVPLGPRPALSYSLVVGRLLTVGRKGGTQCRRRDRLEMQQGCSFLCRL